MKPTTLFVSRSISCARLGLGGLVISLLVGCGESTTLTADPQRETRLPETAENPATAVTTLSETESPAVPDESLPIETDVATLAKLTEEGADFLLLDVRENDEYEICNIEGSELLPLSEFEDRVAELNPHKDRRIIVHCHFGGRSMRVTEALRERGFAKAQNLAGGIDQWSQEIDSSVDRY